MQYGGRVDLIAEPASEASIIIACGAFVLVFVVIPLLYYVSKKG